MDISGKNKKLYIVLAAILIIVIATVTTVVLIPKTDKIVYQVILDGVEGTGVLLREESFVDLSSYEKIYFENVIEGQTVSAGKKIASAYKKGYITATLSKLTETEENIVTYQNQNVITGFDDRTIREYDFQINITISKMSQQEGGYIELYGELCRLMRERESYIRNNYNTETDTYLQQLYADEIAMNEDLSVWCDEFYAEKDGFIGLLCDGAENTLSNVDINAVTFQAVEDAVENQTGDVSGYKVVNDGKWYAVVKVNDVSKFVAGSFYPVYVSNESESEIGYLERIIDTKKEKALVFSFNDNVEKYLDVRNSSFFIGTRYEGFLIDSKFVKNGNVRIKNGKEKQNITVEILYQDKNDTIIKATDQLKVGQKVYSK